MTIAKARLTEDEFLRLPDDGRKYELVDGEIKEVPTTIKHDAIGGNIVLLLGPYIRGRGIVTISQAGFRMKSGNIRAPDVAFTRKERLPGGVPPDTFGDFSPDLAIEILSPSEDPTEIRRKIEEYFESGTQQVWHLFPATQRMTVYMSPTDLTELEAEDELGGGDLLSGFHCRVAELFDVGL